MASERKRARRRHARSLARQVTMYARIERQEEREQARWQVEASRVYESDVFARLLNAARSLVDDVQDPLLTRLATHAVQRLIHGAELGGERAIVFTHEAVLRSFTRAR